MSIMGRLHYKHFIEGKELNIYEKRFLKLAPLKKVKSDLRPRGQGLLFREMTAATTPAR